MKVDTLRFFDEYQRSIILVNKSNYLTEINSTFKDSIKYYIASYINSVEKGTLIELNYYVHIKYYRGLYQVKYFERIFLHLFRKNKIIIENSGHRIKSSDIKTKIIPIYRCGDTAKYCGNDWGLFYDNILLTSFWKSRNRLYYAIISCF